MYVVLKTVNGTTVLAVGPFPWRAQAEEYVAAVKDGVCPAGEDWLVRQLMLPAF